MKKFFSAIAFLATLTLTGCNLQSVPFQSAATETTQYQVVPGNSLWRIAAERTGDPTRYQELWWANPWLTNPDKIYPGQSLRLPSSWTKTWSSPPAAQSTSQTAGWSLPPLSDADVWRLVGWLAVVLIAVLLLEALIRLLTPRRSVVTPAPQPTPRVPTISWSPLPAPAPATHIHVHVTVNGAGTAPVITTKALPATPPIGSTYQGQY